MDLSTCDDLVVVLPSSLDSFNLISFDELEAIVAERDEWKKREFYTGVDDEGQKAVSLRWVIKTRQLMLIHSRRHVYVHVVLKRKTISQQTAQCAQEKVCEFHFFILLTYIA